MDPVKPFFAIEKIDTLQKKTLLIEKVIHIRLDYKNQKFQVVYKKDIANKFKIFPIWETNFTRNLKKFIFIYQNQFFGNLELLV